MTDVTLTIPELRAAAYSGIDRFLRARSRSWAPSHGVARDDWQADILGAWGECAVAKYTNTYWQADRGRPDSGAPDVGPLHVRTATEPWHSLILHQTDDPDAPYVLVIPLTLPTFRIAGWVYAREGQEQRYWQTATGRPCYFVPQTALHPLTDLMTEAAA